LGIGIVARPPSIWQNRAMTYADRLAALRAHLARQRLDGFVVPLTDEHMSEYVGAYAQRLAWLTGFQGSAGTAAVLAADAAIFTDGRYTLQVREQVDGDHWAYMPVPETSVAAWLASYAPDDGRIGYDPWLHTGAWVAETTAALADRGATLVAVDAIWPERPAPSDARLAVHDDALAGASSSAKRGRIADWLAENRADAVVLSALDSIAWTLNVRGGDVAHTPVALAYAIVDADGTTDLFVAPEKLDDAVRQHLGNAVRVHDRSAFARALGGYAGKRIAADPERAVAAITQALDAGGAKVLALRDPVVLAKALKNPVEVAGHRAASVRDGAALARFLRWVEVECVKGGQTELSAASAVGGGARFRTRHGSRHRRLSVGARGAAAHRRAQLSRRRGDGAVARRHDGLERAGLLQGGRLRHPHREPAADRTARDSRRGADDAGVRDADLLPDRAHADRAGVADRAGAGMAERLSCAGAGRAGRGDGGRRPRLAAREMCADRLAFRRWFRWRFRRRFRRVGGRFPPRLRLALAQIGPQRGGHPGSLFLRLLVAVGHANRLPVADIA
jgi:Xaa-Pro aminopeptidase